MHLSSKTEHFNIINRTALSTISATHCETCRRPFVSAGYICVFIFRNYVLIDKVTTTQIFSSDEMQLT